MSNFCINEYGNLIVRIDGNEEYLEYLRDLLQDISFNEIEKDVFEASFGKNKQQENKTIKEIIEYCKGYNISLEVCEKLEEKIQDVQQDNFEDSKKRAADVKAKCPVCNEKWDEHSDDGKNSHLEKFTPDISPRFIRKLQNHQKISVHHLLTVSNGANFSVPGSGKTTITYAVLSKWLDDKIIDKILVIGPVSSFGPWEEEYRFCFGEGASVKRIRGGENARDMKNFTHDLFLISFQSAARYTNEIYEFMRKYNVALIIDESHNVKNHRLEKAERANAALNVSSWARRRMILSGTPMPNDARDLWTQLTILWPNDTPLGPVTPYVRYAKNHGIGSRYKDDVNPLFTRITKKDLGLPNVKIKPIKVPMQPVQKQIYRAIAAKTLKDINSLREQGRLQKFRIAKMIRLIQAASNPSTIFEKADEFELDGIDFGFPGEKIPVTPLGEGIEEGIYEKIINYSKSREIPGKLIETDKIARELIKKGEKVIIWCWSIANIDLLETQLLKDLHPIVIHGGISKNENDFVNREKLIKKFKEDPNPRILIASVSALSESVSLHIDIKIENGEEVKKKVCSNAIYLERNYNGAQFMQSMDRIHRLGMDDIEVTYHCLISENTIDKKIHERLSTKYSEMGEALDDPWIKQLDYDGNEKTINEAQLEKDFQSLVEHLREIDGSNN